MLSEGYEDMYPTLGATSSVRLIHARHDDCVLICYSIEM